jgi:hypothetical protein
MNAKDQCSACRHAQKDDVENCPHAAPDGLPVQCVGIWAEDKHHYLQQYFEATWAVRKKFLPPDGRGGACFVDLFAGPGRVRVRDTGDPPCQHA